jgi:hypothetical protein
MTRKTLKLKINTSGKSYLLTDSPFYKLKTKKKLASLLCLDFKELSALLGSSSQNYNEFTQTSDTGKERVIEHPKPQLEKLHTRIASLLCRIKLPDFIHSGKKGRSHLTNARVHIGFHKVLTTDVRSFFPSTKRNMVFSFFHSKLLCSPDVANLLTDICTYNGHIPTGSRISMPLAFWANADMFFELERLATMHQAKISVYVDDVTFSGDAVNRLFTSTVKNIVSRHGHQVHPNKTVLYKSSDVKIITGLVIKGNDIFIQNKQHAKIHVDMMSWKVIRDEGKDFKMVTKGLKGRLLGRLNSLSIIEPRLKDKARSIKGYIPQRPMEE